MLKYVSISKKPGRVGFFFYNNFFSKYKIKATYEPLFISNIENFFNSEFHKKLSGINVTSPFKSQVIKFLNKSNPEVVDFRSCNTIKIENEVMNGFSTDQFAFKSILELYTKQDLEEVSILGSGSIANLITLYISKIYPETKILKISRENNNMNMINLGGKVLVNATPLNLESLNFSTGFYESIIDLSFESRNPKVSLKYFDSWDFYYHVFERQFRIYTNISIAPDEFYALRKEFLKLNA
jgi:shikimate 5-dehydrogenase